MRLNRAGFTLIELLVALMISGLLATVMFQLLAGQGRFVEIQSAREEVQQNSRAALDLIGNDLRTLPAGESLLAATADSLTIRAPRIWGVICAVAGSSIDVLFPALNGISFGVNSGTGAVVNVGSAAAPAFTDAVSVSAIGAAATSCNGAAIDPNSERRTLTVTSIPLSSGVPAAPGDIVYLYDQVTYKSGISEVVPGRWIQRRQGNDPSQPMAGPIDSSGGLRFSYFSGPTATPVAAPVTDAAVRASISRVMVSVTTVSRTGNDRPETKADTVVITLRNRL